MDPSFRHTILVFLESLDRAHLPADGTAEGDSSGLCTCGAQMPDGRDRHLLEVITEHFAEPELAPHVVHVKPTFVTEDQSEHSEGTGSTPESPVVDVKRKTAKVRRQGVVSCPDCGRGLVSRGDDMICSTLSMKTEVKGCHEGCVVACGVKADG